MVDIYDTVTILLGNAMVSMYDGKEHRRSFDCHLCISAMACRLIYGLLVRTKMAALRAVVTAEGDGNAKCRVQMPRVKLD